MFSFYSPLNQERVGITVDVIHLFDPIIILNNLRPTLQEAIRLNTTLAPLRPIGNVDPVVIGIECARERNGGGLTVLRVLAERPRQVGEHVEEYVESVGRSEDRDVGEDGVGEETGCGDIDFAEIVPDWS